MSDEIRQGYPAGRTLYAVIRQKSGTVWYPTGEAFEDWGTGSRDASDYAISLTEVPVAMYIGDFDTNIDAGRYDVQVFRQAGANPADTDRMVGIIEYVWNGTEVEAAGEVGAAITVAQAKTHLRVTESDDDTYIESLCLAATEWCEEFQKRIYVQRAATYKMDEFPDEIRPPMSPLISVDSIQYRDTDGVLQTLSASLYDIGTYKQPGRIVPAYGESWPATRPMINAVTVTYQAGYASRAAIPEEIKHAVKMLVGHYYENREAVAPLSLKDMPQGIQSLLWIKKSF